MDGLNRARDVRRMHDGNQPRIWPDCSPNIVGGNKTISITGDVADSDVVVFAQCSEWSQHRVVIANRRYHMITWANNAADGQVEHVGAAVAEDDMCRVAGAEKCRHALTAPLD